MIFRTHARATAIAAVTMVGALGTGVVAAPHAAATPVNQEIGYAIAFQADDSRFINGTNSVWGWRGYFSNGFNATALFAGMAPGTSASVGAQSQIGQGSYQVAWQGTDGAVMVGGSSGAPFDTGLGMMPGTSPSLSELLGGGWQVAFQANTGALWVTGSDGTGPVGTVMDPTTSPSITAAPSGGYEVAYQDRSHTLELAGTIQNGPVSGAQLQPGTNPAITVPNPLASSDYEIAYHGVSGTLSQIGAIDNTGNSGWLMYPGTSPTITGIAPTPNGSDPYEIAFEGGDSTLWGLGGLASGPINGLGGIPMLPGASPGITGIYLPRTLVGNQLLSGYQIAYEGSTGTLWTTIGSPAFTTEHITTNIGVHLDPTTIPSVAYLVQ